MEINRYSPVRPPLVTGPNAQQCAPNDPQLKFDERSQTNLRNQRGESTFEQPRVLTKDGRTDRSLDRMRQKVNQGEGLSPDERARLRQITNTPKIEGGDVRVQGYVQRKTSNGTTSQTQRADYGYSIRDGFTARKTQSTSTEKGVDLGKGIGVKIESGIKNKSDASSSTYSKLRVQAPNAFGQIEVNNKGQVTVSGGLEVRKDTKVGNHKTSSSAGVQVDVTLPKGNQHQRELAQKILERDASNKMDRRMGYSDEMIRMRRPL